MSEDPPSDPFFHLEAHTIEELVEGLERLGIDPGDLKVEPPRKKRPPRPEQDPSAPPQATPDLIREVAESIPDPSLSPSRREPEELVLTGDRSRGAFRRALAKGAALRRFQQRQARLLAREAAYVHQDQAILGKEPTDRQAAVAALEAMGEHTRLARVAQWCVHLMTRRQAVEALYRCRAVDALEDIALFTRPPEAPQPRNEPGDPPTPGPKRAQDDGFDEVQNYAVDKIAELADADVPGALESLIRLARYDYSRHGYAQFHAIRRLGERVALLEARHDVDSLAMVFNTSKNPHIRQTVLAYFERHLSRLREECHLDALHLLLEYAPERAAEVEDILREIEGGA